MRSERFHFRLASKGPFENAYRPKSRAVLDQWLQKGLRENGRARRHYEAVLRSLHPDHRFGDMSDRVLARHVGNAIWFGRIVVTRAGQDATLLGTMLGAATVSQYDSPMLGPMDVLAAGLALAAAAAWFTRSSGSITLPSPAIAANHHPTRATSLTDPAAIAWELLDNACTAPTNVRAAAECQLLFHYTDAWSFGAISRSSVIRPNAKGWVYATWLPQSPQDVETNLILNPFNAGKGAYVFAFTRRPGVRFIAGEQPNELKHQGSLRIGKHVDILYAGRNPLPDGPS